MRFHYFFTGLFNLLFAFSVNAADVPFTFDNETDAERYRNLVEELRCLVCQNQTLADSGADLAQDLRNEIYQMIQTGRSNDEIVDFLVDRYGDFVLYRPPLNTTTILLWFGPFLIFTAAILIVIRIIRRQSMEVPEQQGMENRGKHS
ncbi:MAG: cytochrome c-type biogenesis protein CcmH [Gammaproteobacteria bacterium]|nr:cytochrome c-type biogenesis protein CcmH [Gammaproteobacteria bacterium]